MKNLYVSILEDLTREGVPESFIIRQMESASAEGVHYVDYFDYIFDRWDAFHEIKGVIA